MKFFFSSIAKKVNTESGAHLVIHFSKCKFHLSLFHSIIYQSLVRLNPSGEALKVGEIGRN